MHHHHHHTPTDPHAGSHQARKRLVISLIITLSFVLIEAAAGYFSNSLALLSDAGHNLTDAITLGLSWFAMKISLRPANSQKTFGYHRAGILIAVVNASTLIFIAVSILYEAYDRFTNPQVVNAPILIWVGLLALLVNAVTAGIIWRDSHNDLNIRSAFVHLMGDVFSTIGAVAAGILIFFTGWSWLDPLVSVFIAGLIIYNTWGVLREGVNILLESTPSDVNLDQMIIDLLSIKGVVGIHDLHVWSINKDLRTLSAHVETFDQPISEGDQIKKDVRTLLFDRYYIKHSTLQLECKDCEGIELFCDLN